MSRSALLNAIIILPLVLLLLAGAAVRGADLPTAGDKPIAPGVQRERVSLVLVEAVVTSASGRFVDDLRPEEFTLLVDGKEVTIQSVDLQAVGGEAPRAASPEIPGEVAAPPTEAAVSVIPGHRSFVLFFDGLNCELGLGPEAVRSARKFLQEGLPSGEEVMIVGLGRDFVIYQDFTPDLSLALAALDEVDKDPRLRMGGQDRSRSNLDLMEDHRRSGTGHDVALGRMFGIEDRRRAMRFTLALRGLVGYLQPRQGRKEIFLFSDGFASKPEAFYFPTKEADLENELLRLSQEAASAQAALNPINTQGLPAPRTYEMYREAKLDPALAILAVNSGGVLTHRVNRDFQKPMRAIEEQTRATYLLSYAPPGEPDGRLHATRVLVNRKEVTVRAEEGYVWMTEQQRRERETLSAYLAPEFYRAIPLTLLAGSHLERGEKPALDLAIAVPNSSVLLLPQEGHRLFRLEAGIVLRSQEGKAQDEFSRSIEGRLSGGTPGTTGDLTLVMRRFVPPGEYEATVVVRDLESGEVGALRAPVSVPPLSPDQITLSSLNLLSLASPGRRIDLDSVEGEERPTGVPSVRRIFTRTESIGGFVSIYHPARDPATGEARVTVRILINRGGETVRPLAAQRHLLRAREGSAFLPVEFPLDLSDLEPGPYELQLDAWDEVALRSATRLVGFTVR